MFRSLSLFWILSLYSLCVVNYPVLRGHLDSWYRTKVNMKKPWELWGLHVESSCCFYQILGRCHIFFQGELMWQQSIKGEEWRLTTNKGDCKNVTELYLGGGGSKSVSSDPSFRPWHLKHSHPIGTKYHCVGRYNTFTCYLQFARKPRPCSSQCAKTNWKPQETKQHHSTERDRNGNQLEALSSCNLRKKEKQMTNVALLPS